MRWAGAVALIALFSLSGLITYCSGQEAEEQRQETTSGSPTPTLVEETTTEGPSQGTEPVQIEQTTPELPRTGGGDY